ncbi:hypothetical protein [Candidatus Tisiphia endosymbiont of Micropterix aruncella]|uniref:hypothetical protein n=1 Tax=Candidatus Tisiphia endosymbiont of Micropterix aruncella TaxID=3066271 RepID=UPI003AA9C1C9
MRKIVVKFNKSKDIENLKKIMKNVYTSNSDHLPDIAKFHLGEKVFIPNQVEKAELHIITASDTEIITFSKATLSFYLGRQHPFTKVAMSSEDEGNYIVLPWNLGSRVGRDNLKNLINLIPSNVRELKYIIYVNSSDNLNSLSLESSKDLSQSLTSLASLHLSDIAAEDETEGLLNKIADLEQRLSMTAQTWTFECPINVIGRGDGSNILSMAGCTLTLAGNSITATNLKSYVSVDNVAGNVILDIVNKKLTIGGSRCGPIDIH